MKGIGLLSALLVLAAPAAAQSGGIQQRATVYGWLAGVDGKSRFPVDDPTPVEIDVSQIIEDIEMVFMGNYEARFDQWSLFVDAVYLDLGDSRSVETAAGQARLGLDLESWVVHGAVGYELPGSERTTVNLVAGVRYLSLDAELDASLGDGPGRSASESESVTDAFLGVRGRLALNDRWFLPYHADLGAGGSDYSYQLFTGVGYRAGAVDFEVGYRHLYFEFGDKRFMQEFQISGPALGLAVNF